MLKLTWLAAVAAAGCIVAAIRTSNDFDASGVSTESRLRPGWAVICTGTCSLEWTEEGSQSPVVNFMDATKVRIGMVVKRMDAELWLVQSCEMWISADCEPADILAHPDCVSKPYFYPESSLFNIPVVSDQTSDPVLNFRGFPVRDVRGILESIDKEFPTMTSMNDDQDPHMFAKAYCFKASLLCQAKSLDKNYRLQAEESKFLLELDTAYASLMDTSEILEEQWTAVMNAIDAERMTTHCEDDSNQDETQLKNQLDIGRDKHRKDESSQLKRLALDSFFVVFHILEIAADVFFPGLGTIMEAVKKASEHSLAAALSIGTPAMIQTLETMNGELAQVALLTHGLSPIGAPTPAQNHNNSQADLVEGVKQAKNIMKKCLITIISQGIWSLAIFIPIIGPYVMLAKSVIDLMVDINATASDHLAYLQWKDPMLRSLFRMRDCFLDAFLFSGSVQVAKDVDAPLKHRELAVKASSDFIESAVSINSDLVSRLRKQVWTLGSAEGHEAKVMERLKKGVTSFWVFGQVKDNPHAGDTYLPEDEVAPRKWDELIATPVKKVSQRKQQL